MAEGKLTWQSCPGGAELCQARFQVKSCVCESNEPEQASTGTRGPGGLGGAAGSKHLRSIGEKGSAPRPGSLASPL